MSGSVKNKTTTPLQQVLWAFGLLLLVVIAGTIGFVLLEKRSVFDALYMTLVTVSTLGMKPQSSIAITTVGKIWIMFLIVVGIGSFMVAITVMVSMVVEGKMRTILGRRKLDVKISSLDNHIIVCGYGRMGRMVADNLRRRKENLVVIDSDDSQTSQAEQDGMLYLLGDATDEKVLKAAGIERARALVAVLDTDAANVFAALMARDLNRDIFIAARAEKGESEYRLIRAGANRTICPHVIGACRLANILTRPGLVDFIDFAAQGIDLEADQYVIEQENKLIGLSLRQANLPRKVGTLIIALKRNNEVIFNPDADMVIQAGDVLILTGKTGAMAKLKQEYS